METLENQKSLMPKNILLFKLDDKNSLMLLLLILSV